MAANSWNTHINLRISEQIIISLSQNVFSTQSFVNYVDWPRWTCVD